MPLTEATIKAAKPADKSYKLFDAEGLYLEVAPSGGKWWRLKYRFAGREKRLSLGVYPAVPLLQARKSRDDAKRLLADGIDPSQHRRRDKLAEAIAAGNTFAEVAKVWHDSWSRTRTPKHAAQVWRRLELDVLPKIGGMPIASVETPDIVALAKAVEQRGAHDLARRAIQISGQVFRYAIGHGLAKHNPAREINPGDVLAPVKERNYARVDAGALPRLPWIRLRHKAPSTPSLLPVLGQTTWLWALHRRAAQAWPIPAQEEHRAAPSCCRTATDPRRPVWRK